jgi:hypothetical protein
MSFILEPGIAKCKDKQAYLFSRINVLSIYSHLPELRPSSTSIQTAYNRNSRTVCSLAASQIVPGTLSPRPESGGFRFRSAPSHPRGAAPQNRRTLAAPDSSLSVSLKTLPFRFLAHFLRLRCSVSVLSLCASGPTQMGEQGPPPRVCWQTKRHEQANSENKTSR